MKSPSGLPIPADIANRLDGILDEIDLRNLKKPSVDDLIEQAVQDIEAWEGSLGESGEAETIAVWDVVCKLEIIAILARLREKELVA